MIQPERADSTGISSAGNIGVVAQTNIKNKLWLVYLVFIVLAAIFSADIINVCLQQSLFSRIRSGQPPRSGGRTKKTQLASARLPASAYDRIADRCLFNSQCVKVDPNAAKAGEEEATPFTELNIKIVGIFYTSQHPVAFLQSEKDPDVAVISVGEPVLESGYEVSCIRPKKVCFRSIGSRSKEKGKGNPCQKQCLDFDMLDFGDVDKKAKSPAKPGQQTQAELASYDGIQEVSQNDFKIEDRVIQNALSDLGTILRDARVMPNLNQGRIDGFKIFAIKPDSLFRKIGLRDGDILQTVNGYEIDGPQKGMELFEQLKNSNDVRMTIKRDGSPIDLNYTIR